MQPTWLVMSSRMLMNFSFPCLMGFMKRWRRIKGNPRVKVNPFQLNKFRVCDIVFWRYTQLQLSVQMSQ